MTTYIDTKPVTYIYCDTMRQEQKCEDYLYKYKLFINPHAIMISHAQYVKLMNWTGKRAI